ncbi:MAG TPA: MarR family transcriptional regulator [Vicinamibacteria bacterium]
MANDLGSRAPGRRAVADRLHAAAIHLLRGLRRQDARTGVGPARLSALSVLVFAGPMSLARLAAAEQVTPPTMSRIVQALAAAGLVAREPDARDRRRVVLAATRAGRRVMHRGRRRRVAALAARLRALSPPEVVRLAEAAALIERVAREPV